MKKYPVHKSKTIGHYLRIYILSAFVGIFVFALGSIIFKPQVPCANSKSCLTDLTEKIDNNTLGMFDGHTVIPPTIDPSKNLPSAVVLGDSTTSGDKHIYVDLSTQILYAYEGKTKVMQTFISSGRWGPTPVGNFHVWEKLRSTEMAGGEGASAYDLPNVPYVMYFYHDWGLHGAYWHMNFGHTMSHGCVNMRIVDAQALFNWADGPSGSTLGTPVSVCNHFSEPNMCQQDNPIQ